MMAKETTELRSSELTTSSTLRLTRSSAGTSATSPPAAAPASAISSMASGPGIGIGADEGGGNGARHQLALGADVPEFGAEGDGDRKAGEDHRGGLDQRLGDVELGAERAAEHDAVGLEDAGAATAR